MSRGNRREDIFLDDSSKNANVRLHVAMRATVPAYPA